MRDLYYKLWSDAINYEKEKHSHIRNWKPYVLFGISFCQGLNLATILFWLSTWLKFGFFLEINIFPGEILNSAMSGIITLYLPFIIFNYILIFRNKKYNIVLEAHPYQKGKLYIGYYLLSFSIFIIPILIGFLINRLGY